MDQFEKTDAIKAVYKQTGCSLKEAKDLIDSGLSVEEAVARVNGTTNESKYAVSNAGDETDCSKSEMTVFPDTLLRFEEDLHIKIGASKIKTIPYSVNKNTVENAFENFIIQGDDAPLDIAWSSRNFQIDTILFPVRCFNVTYAANWSATSIWQHEEPYTVYEPNTIYFDFLGREHDSPGFDVFVNGSYRFTERCESAGSLLSAAVADERRPFTPQQRMEAVTRYNSVTDDIRQTTGSIGGASSFQPIIAFDDERQKGFADWVFNTPMHKVYAKSIDADNASTDCFVMPLAKSNAFAQSIAASNVKKIAEKQCRKDVPGDSIQNFHVELNADYDMEVLMIPLYRVIYEYQGKKYECWYSGMESRAPYYKSKPRDKKLKMQIKEGENISKEINAYEKKTRKRIGLLAVSSFVFWIAGSLIFLSVIPTFISLGLIGVLFVWASKFNAQIEKNKQKQVLSKEEHLFRFKKIREDIMGITKRSDLSEREKEQKIHEILKD